MSTPVIITIGLTGMIVFMLLAWWVWKRGDEFSRLDDEQDGFAPTVQAATARTATVAPAAIPTSAAAPAPTAGPTSTAVPVPAVLTTTAHAPTTAAPPTAAPPTATPPRPPLGPHVAPTPPPSQRGPNRPKPPPLKPKPPPKHEPTQVMAMEFKPESTEFMPMPEQEPETEPTQFMPMPEQEPETEPTQFMPMPEPGTAQIPPPSVGTETISTEEIQSLIAQHRRIADMPATSSAAAPSTAASSPAQRPSLPSPPPAAPAVGIAKLQPPTPPARSGPPEIPHDTLLEHFDAALAQIDLLFTPTASRDLDALVAGPEKAWQTNREVLALTALRSLDEFALPTLRDAKASESRRRGAAALALELEKAKGPEALVRELGTLDTEGRAAGLWALAHWSSERAAGIVQAELARAEKRERMDWLRVLEQRGDDPGDLVAEVLNNTKEPVELAWALRMLLVHAHGKQLVGKTGRHVMIGAPTIRMAALRAALAFQQPAAWTHCKTASRDPMLPEACMLFAMLGSASEINDLVAWASKASEPAPHVGWALGVSGRVAGMEACIERLGHADSKIASEALAGLRHATGYAGEAAPAAVRSWWATARERFTDDRRYVGGEPLSLAAIRSALARGTPATRAALELEIQIRSPGRAGLPSAAWPSRERAALDTLSSRELDLTRTWK